MAGIGGSERVDGGGALRDPDGFVRTTGEGVIVSGGGIREGGGAGRIVTSTARSSAGVAAGVDSDSDMMTRGYRATLDR
jgi:hypothetical protein